MGKKLAIVSVLKLLSREFYDRILMNTIILVRIVRRVYNVFRSSLERARLLKKVAGVRRENKWFGGWRARK